MIQLRILSGKQAGLLWNARRFPVRVGRGSACDLQSVEDGLWEQHLRIDFKPGEGFLATAEPNALASVNGESFEQVLLRNGDILDLGSLSLQFWLSEMTQTGYRLREMLTWAGITLLALAQVGLIYWLVRGV